jgi:hypothetical protein
VIAGAIILRARRPMAEEAAVPEEAPVLESAVRPVP